jgi:hypothetical protein
MPACERCWADAATPGGDHAERYRTLLVARASNPYTPEEQAGPHASACPVCGRRTVHQHARVCMAPDCRWPWPKEEP